MVYIGKRKYKYGRMYMSHMVADTLDELHDTARLLGVRRDYFQNKPGKPHYDICQQNKKFAIDHGYACEISDKDIILLFTKPKTKNCAMCFDGRKNCNSICDD